MFKKFCKASKLFFCLLLPLSLQGCVNVAMSGASALYNRYAWQNQFSNQQIALTTNKTIKDDPSFSQSNIKVTCFDYYVLLIGETNSEIQRKKASKIASSFTGVKRVYNFIEIKNLSQTSEELYDNVITGKIKSEIIAKGEMDPTKIKVITENGTVYLMGTLTTEQANIATDIARKTSGVKHVVKIIKCVD